MRIRPATPDDYPAIAAVQAASWKDAYKGVRHFLVNVFRTMWETARDTREQHKESSAGDLCRVNGEYRVLVDRRSPLVERIGVLLGALGQAPRHGTAPSL